MDMPPALIIHGVNDAHVERYKKFIELLGGKLHTIKPGDYGRYLLIFPDNATIGEVREIRPDDDPDGGYTQVDIYLGEEYYLTWYRNVKIGHPQEEHNRIVVPVVQLNEVGA